MKLTRIIDGRWLLEHGSVVLPLDTRSLDEMALAVAFRLYVEDVEPTGSGVSLRVSTEFTGSGELHFCFSDEAAQMARRIVTAAQLPGGIGDLLPSVEQLAEQYRQEWAYGEVNETCLMAAGKALELIEKAVTE